MNCSVGANAGPGATPRCPLPLPHRLRHLTRKVRNRRAPPPTSEGSGRTGVRSTPQRTKKIVLTQPLCLVPMTMRQRRSFLPQKTFLSSRRRARSTEQSSSIANENDTAVVTFGTNKLGRQTDGFAGNGGEGDDLEDRQATLYLR